jgi:hypothetical protein
MLPIIRELQKTAAALKFYLQQHKEWGHQERLDKIVKESRCPLLQ